MRTWVIAAPLLFAASAFAEPSDRLEASGFVGVDYYGAEIGLGGSPAPEQRPQTSPTFGGRLTYVPLRLGPTDMHLDVGVEAELTFTPSWTGYGFDGPRPSVFAPVFGYHASALVRLGGGWFQPHVTAGGGGETVASSSKFMADETDPIFLWGVGASFPFERWQLRFDARQGLMEAMDGGTTQTYEATVGIGARFGTVAKASRVEKLPEPQVADAVPPVDPNTDTDADGIADRLDICPTQPEAVNGVADHDGCPEPDTDGDGLVGSADRCPDRAEDVDQFLDDDGCPDEDNDHDGVTDLKDKCPLQAENVNGIADDDGCVDQIPAAITKALASASAVKFERKRSRVTSASKKALEQALLVMLDNPRLKFTITAHPEKATEADTELAKKRAEALRWHLIEQGAAAKNLTATIGPAVTDRKAPIIVLSVSM